MQDLSKESFPLPTLGPKLVSIRDEVVNGKGFQLIRSVTGLLGNWPYWLALLPRS